MLGSPRAASASPPLPLPLRLLPLPLPLPHFRTHSLARGLSRFASVAPLFLSPLLLSLLVSSCRPQSAAMERAQPRPSREPFTRWQCPTTPLPRPVHRLLRDSKSTSERRACSPEWSRDSSDTPGNASTPGSRSAGLPA